MKFPTDMRNHYVEEIMKCAMKIKNNDNTIESRQWMKLCEYEQQIGIFVEMLNAMESPLFSKCKEIESKPMKKWFQFWRTSGEIVTATCPDIENGTKIKASIVVDCNEPVEAIDYLTADDNGTIIQKRYCDPETLPKHVEAIKTKYPKNCGK